MSEARAILRPDDAPRPLAEEVPVALVYNGTTQAVMMATPADLEDFAVGFTATEGIAAPRDILELEIVDHGAGREARMWLREGAADRLARRRRAMAGPVGCGLCGIDSIEQALVPAAVVTNDALRLRPLDLRRAPQALRACQPLHDATHAVHAAGLWRPGQGLVLAREDVGRHNALDKLVGAALRAAEAGPGVPGPVAEGWAAEGRAAEGRAAVGRGAAVVLTSRVSVEMVQKAAALGAEAILAVSAPTALATRMADEAGLTLVAGLKGGAAPALTHTHPHRLERA